MLFLLGGSRIAWRNGAEYEINTTKQSRETEGEIFLKTELGPFNPAVPKDSFLDFPVPQTNTSSILLQTV